VQPVSRNRDGTWLQLDSGTWIWAPLVDRVPTGLPVAATPSPVPPTPVPSVPLPANAVTISAGAYYTCAVRTDGTLACWGLGKLNDTGEWAFGQATPPSGSFTTVSAGTGHTCGIRTDGTLACWGNNEMGQATSPGGTFSTGGPAPS
jgi:hypothetical protein